jgi:hypothetical protein
MEGPATVVERDGIVAAHQPDDDIDGVLEELARLRHVEPDHLRIAGQRPGSQPEHEPPACHVVELHRTLRHPQRVVVAGAHDPRAELDVAGALGSGGDEDLRRGDDLGAGRVVLADPRLVEPQPIEVLYQLQVVVQQHCRVLTRRVERCHEDTEAHTSHLAPSSSAGSRLGTAGADGIREETAGRWEPAVLNSPAGAPRVEHGRPRVC